MPGLRERLEATGKHFYCICFTVRSGSTLLRDDLAQWHLGAAHEYFQPELYAGQGLSADEYVMRVVNQSPEAHFGFKITWDQLCYLTSALRTQGERGVEVDLRTVFPGLRHIYLVRNDQVGQAISWWRADASGTWHVPAGDRLDRGAPAYDRSAILEHLKLILLDNFLWSRYFAERRIPHLRVEYEEYLERRRPGLEAMAEFLGAHPSGAKLRDRTQVMRDDWSRQVAERFSGDLEDPRLPRISIPPPAASLGSTS